MIYYVTYDQIKTYLYAEENPKVVYVKDPDGGFCIIRKDDPNMFFEEESAKRELERRNAQSNQGLDGCSPEISDRVGPEECVVQVPRQIGLLAESED